ncbi:MAG: SIS domain-containing protein [Nanoarchaeota archaeon]|nr:SIS domain-containing protein [Nanoarchaeota archaeon]
MEDLIKRELNEGILVKKAILARNVSQIIELAKLVIEAYKNKGRMIIFGNGGSAADAQHIVAELVNYLYNPKRPMLDALALTVNTSVVTAISNDIGYENVFAKQIESLATNRDVVLGISTSGNSLNVINGMKTARRNGAKCVALTGKDGGGLNELNLDLLIKVQSEDTARIQEGHIAIGHIMCSLVEKELFDDKEIKVKNFIEAAAPARISLANGGDTDSFIQQLGRGCVVNATLSSHYFKCRILPQDIDYVEVNYGNEKKVFRELANNDIVAATLKRLKPDFRGIIWIETNIPKMSGLGGSSALNIALIKALYKLDNKKYDAEEVAKLAYQIERKDMGIKGGYQDQWASAYGGINFLEFTSERVKVQPLNVNAFDKFEDNLLLVYFGERACSGDAIHSDQIKNVEINPLKIRNLLIEKRFNVENLKSALVNGDFDEAGRMMHKDFMLKRKLSSKISTNAIDDIYKKALSNGAIGGRILGAGGGGCGLFYCNKGMKGHLAKVLESEGIRVLPFRFERK